MISDFFPNSTSIENLSNEINKGIKLLKLDGFYANEEAIDIFGKAIDFLENYTLDYDAKKLLSKAHTYKGIAFLKDIYSENEARFCFEVAIKIDPSYSLPRNQINLLYDNKLILT